MRRSNQANLYRTTLPSGCTKNLTRSPGIITARQEEWKNCIVRVFWYADDLVADNMATLNINPMALVAFQSDSSRRSYPRRHLCADRRLSALPLSIFLLSVIAVSPIYAQTPDWTRYTLQMTNPPPTDGSGANATFNQRALDDTKYLACGQENEFLDQATRPAAPVTRIGFAMFFPPKACGRSGVDRVRFVRKNVSSPKRYPSVVYCCLRLILRLSTYPMPSP
jgi:hypothetical protein